jgi:hypothetical protein
MGILAIVGVRAPDGSAMVVGGGGGCGEDEGGECKETETTKAGDIFPQNGIPKNH